MAGGAQGHALQVPRPDLRHQQAELRNGISMHYVVAEPLRSFPAPLATVVLVHGWPDCWFGWRRQLGALAEAGFRAVAPDCRGYGGTSAPEEDSAYSHEFLCHDMVCLLDHLGVASAVFVGHDWGGTLVWNLAQAFPERVCAVGAFCTPFMPTPEVDPWAQMQRKAPGSRFDYQMYFQGQAAVDEMDADPSRTFRAILRSPAMVLHGVDRELMKVPPTMRKPRPGFVNHFPEGGEVARDSSVLLDESELEYYVAQNRQCGGFHGGLRWYRNVHANWHFMRKALERRGMAKPRIEQEALMVTAGLDAILTPAMVDRYTVPYVPNLARGHVEGAGHWVLQETCSSGSASADAPGVPHHARATAILLAWLQSPRVLQSATGAAAAAQGPPGVVPGRGTAARL